LKHDLGKAPLPFAGNNSLQCRSIPNYFGVSLSIW
jgi:hypothetical protein